MIDQKINWPKLIKKPEGKNIVVLAPHMDDEIIGCAGVICKHIEAGDQVSVIYMTDGSKGIPGKAFSQELLNIRKEEAERSNMILGIKDSFYFNIIDSSNNTWDEYKNSLGEILKQKRPDIVYLPIFNDIHPDHQKTNILFACSAEDITDCMVCAYEIWSPLNPNIIVNITKQMSLKLKAIREHKSQISLIRYDHMAISINRYRACFMPLPGIRFAEAFLLNDCHSYIAQIQKANF